MNAELARSQAELRKKNEIMEEDLKMARKSNSPCSRSATPASLGRSSGGSLLQFRHVIFLPVRWVAISSTCLRLSEQKAGLFICDVMGHGVRSALVRRWCGLWSKNSIPSPMDPGQLLTRINSDIRSILQQTGTPLFTTAFYMVVRSRIAPSPLRQCRTSQAFSSSIAISARWKYSSTPMAKPVPL